MSTGQNKGPRKLQLMPEVLPAPDTGQEGSRSGTPSIPGRPGPRERTVARLSRLMAVAAAGAALSGCGDEKGSGSTAMTTAGTTAGSGNTASPPTTTSADPATTSSAPSTTTTSSAAAELPDAGADADAGGHLDAGAADAGSSKVKPAQQQPKRDRGYQVVDMLPSPSRGGDKL